jgi:hypothetical protein
VAENQLSAITRIQIVAGVDVGPAMLVFEYVLGTLLLVIGVALGDSYFAGLMVGVSIGTIASVMRKQDVWPAWFQDFSLLLLGTSFLISEWWLVYHGRGSSPASPAFKTFGPGFLLMAAYGFAKRRLATRSKVHAPRSAN